MYKVFYFLSIFVALARDYFFISDVLAKFIFTIMVVDAVVEIVLKPFSLRSPNYGVRYNFFYSSRATYHLLALISTVAAIIFTFGYYFYSGDILLLCLLILAKGSFKLTTNKIIHTKHFDRYYFVELLKNLSIALSFYLETLWIYLFSLLFLIYVSKIITSNVKVREGCNNLLVLKVYWRDKLLILQAFMSAAFVLFDKSLTSIKSDSSFLEFLLLTKFVLFSLNLFSGLSLQIFHLNNRLHRKSITSVALIKSNFLVISGLLLSFVFFFSIFVNYLPTGKGLDFSYDLILMAGTWMFVMLIREAAIKSSQMRGQFKIVSILVLTLIPVHILTVLYIQPSVFSLLSLNILTSIFIITGLLFSEYHKKNR